MKLMLCTRGQQELFPELPGIVALGAGLELGSYGLVGIRSPDDWQACFSRHKAVRDRFAGPIAIHGPFIGIEYGHVDHLIRSAIQQRLDMTLEAAIALKAGRLVFHGGYSPVIERFQLQESWLKQSAAFWQKEIGRWAAAGIDVVLENETEASPDLLVRLVEAVDHPALGLCMDIGHQHLFSTFDAPEWVRRMARRLRHIHLHDNDRTADRHWAPGRGTVAYEPFFDALRRLAPDVTVSLEVEDTLEVRMASLRRLAATVGLTGGPA